MVRRGRLAERSNAAVLKTVEVQASGGSNPSPSARQAEAGHFRAPPRLVRTNTVRDSRAETIAGAIGLRANCGMTTEFAANCTARCAVHWGAPPKVRIPHALERFPRQSVPMFKHQHPCPPPWVYMGEDEGFEGRQAKFAPFHAQILRRSASFDLPTRSALRAVDRARRPRRIPHALAEFLRQCVMPFRYINRKLKFD